MPEVSVIIPVYNQTDYLIEALKSVFAQTYSDLEVIVVDDGSTEPVAPVIAGMEKPVRCIRVENGGVARARNIGIQNASGKYIALLDADDLWFPRKIEVQMKTVDANKDVDLVYTGAVYIDRDGRYMGKMGQKIQRVSHNPFKDLLVVGNIVGTPSTVLAKKACFQQLGGFDVSLSVSADWDMWIRFSRHYRFILVDESLASYRIHGDNMHLNMVALERDITSVLNKHFNSRETREELAPFRRAVYSSQFLSLAGCYWYKRAWKDFFRTTLKAVAYNPLTLLRLLITPLRWVLYGYGRLKLP